MGNSTANAIRGAIKSFSNKTGSEETYFYFLPKVPYKTIDSTHVNETYFKELLKWICSNYKNQINNNSILFFNANPNSQGWCILHIYDISAVDSNGLPQYAGGCYMSLSATLCLFGTSNYSFFYGTK